MGKKAGKPAAERHPLEGEYLVWRYIEQEDKDIGEGSAIALYHLQGNKLNQLYHPRDHVWQASDMGDDEIAAAIGILKKLDVRKVYSVFHLEEFYGIPHGWFSTEDAESKARQIQERKEEGIAEKDDEECHQWVEYARIDDMTSEGIALEAAGIEVLSWEAPRIKGLESRLPDKNSS